MRAGVARRFISTQLPPSAFPAWRPRDFFHHEVLHRSRKEGSRARVGRLHTPHGTVETPGFVVVGTNGAVKFVDHHAADAAGMELMFANTLHLIVHPGAASVERAGGLHRLMGRENRPIISDSGGFQIFSFANRGQAALPGEGSSDSDRTKRDGYGDGGDDEDEGERTDLKSSRPPAARFKYATEATNSGVRVTEDGAHFRSYRDGSKLFLSPELSVQAQKAIGADIIIPLDDLPAAALGPNALALSVARTHRWEARSLRAHLDDQQQQAMYCVLHGGLDRQLRAASVELLSQLPFDGYCIGGSLGRSPSDMLDLLRDVMPMLPTDKPNHLLGIGDEPSIRAAVSLGIDSFDSCFPTRLGRHGTLLTREGRLKIGKAKFRDDYSPVDAACDGFVSTNYSRAYLHHLWRANEPVVHGLLTLHNIKFMADLMAGLREAILRDEL